MGAFGVEFVAVGIGVADDVEPFERPAFAVGGAGEEAVDELVVGVFGGVFEEGFDFGVGGGHAGKVERGAADEGALIGLGGGGEGFGFQAFEDKGVDGVGRVEK